MSATLVIASYAAVVATADLGWRIFARFVSKRTRLEVTISKTLPKPGRVEEVVIRVIYRSEHPVPIAGSFVWQEATGRMWYVLGPGAAPTQSVAPLDAKFMRQRLDKFDGLVFGEPAIAVVITQDETTFRSAPTVIVDRPPAASIPPRS